MIEAMRRRLETQARLQSSEDNMEVPRETSEDSKSPSLTSTPVASAGSPHEAEAASPCAFTPPPATGRAPFSPSPALFKDADLDSIFVPEAEAAMLRRPTAPPQKPAQSAGFPEVWDEAFQSAQRVETALARLQEALERDEKHARRTRRGGAAKVARPRRPRPLRVATL